MLRRRMHKTSYSGHQLWKQPPSNSNNSSPDVVLASPNEECPFMLRIDASGVSIAGILSQADDNGDDQPITYFGRKLLLRE